MEVLILLLLAVSTYSLDVSRQYHFINVAKTWFGAQSYCRENFDDLATIASADDSERMKDLGPNAGQNLIWIGLYDDVNSWRWSLDDTYLYTDGNTQLESWFDFIPDNSGSKQHHGYMQGGTIYDGQSTALMRSVCYDEPSNTYIAVTDLMSWEDAQSYCRQTYTDLASIRNQQEMETIKSLTDANQWWLGLFRDTWKWSDGSNSSFRFWKSGEPDSGRQDCIGAVPHEWGDITCSRKMPFICSGPPRKVLKFFLKTDGSVDLSDTNLQEAVLMEIEKLLRQRAEQQEFQLQWKRQPNGNFFNLL